MLENVSVTHLNKETKMLVIDLVMTFKEEISVKNIFQIQSSILDTGSPQRLLTAQVRSQRSTHIYYGH